MVKTWIASVLLVALPAVSLAAGPAKIASYNRTLWSEPIDSPQRYDRASRQEILAFVRVIATSPLTDVASIQAFTGVKVPNTDGVEQWLSETRLRLVDNYAAASLPCVATGECLSAGDWQSLVLLANKVAIASEEGQWRSAAQGFYSTYLYEQVRLAALFPGVTSEIAKLDERERNGFELADRQFVLTFDDGPSRNSESDQLAELLRANGQEAFFFALGERLSDRLNTQGPKALGELYRGQCLASHGYSHVPHQKLAGWKKSLADTLKLTGLIQPDSAGRSWFRPPYGQRTREQVAYIDGQGGRVLLWNIDSQDWNARLSAEAMRDRVITLMLLWRRGVLLFHDVHPKARAVLPQLNVFMQQSDLTPLSCQQLINLADN